MASTDYTGRTVDLLIFQGVEEFGDQPLTTGWGDAGELCTGIQKIAQTWAILFLTDRGTIFNEPERGSSFVVAVRSGAIQVDEDVPAEFSIAATQVARTMSIDATDQNLEDDEILDRAELLDYRVDTIISNLYLRVRIWSLAGESRTVFLPIPFSIK